MTPDPCPSCNESIGISVAWCAACAAWFRAVKEGYCTVDLSPRPQQREENGRYDFDGGNERMCVCGCTLGIHSASSPHECIAYSMPKDGGDYRDCRCQKFRQSRKHTKPPCAAENVDLH